MLGFILNIDEFIALNRALTIGWFEYLDMYPEESSALLNRIMSAVNKERDKQRAEASLDALAAKYGATQTQGQTFRMGRGS